MLSFVLTPQGLVVFDVCVFVYIYICIYKDNDEDEIVETYVQKST